MDSDRTNMCKADGSISDIVPVSQGLLIYRHLVNSFLTAYAVVSIDVAHPQTDYSVRDNVTNFISNDNEPG